MVLSNPWHMALQSTYFQQDKTLHGMMGYPVLARQILSVWDCRLSI